MDKAKRIFYWFFTEEENTPMGFIPTFFTIIVVSIITGIFIVPIVNKLMQ